MAGNLGDGIDQRPSGLYRARYRDADGTMHSKSFGKLAEARAWRTDQMAALRAGTHVAAIDGSVKFGDFAEQRMKTWRAHRDTTKAQVESHYRCHIEPFFGNRPIGKVSHSEIEAWVTQRSEVLAPATLHVVMSWLRRIFADAVRLRMIPNNPCDDVALPRVIKKEVVPFTLDEANALADAMPDRWRCVVLVSLWAGLRQGEVLGLRKHRIDTLGRRDPKTGERQHPSIYVAEQLQTVGYGKPTLVPPKTKKSERRVPMPDVLVQELAAHLAKFPTDDQGFVFTTARTRQNPEGLPIRRSRFGEAWRAAVKDAGLPQGTVFHRLRHTYASLLIEAGESVVAVSHRLGHASPVETLETYSHLWPDNFDRTVSSLNRVHAEHVSRAVSWGTP